MKDIKDISKRSFELTERIIKETGPRLAGTEQSLKAAKILHKELEVFCDKTDLEEFTVHKGAFLGWIKILVTSYLLSLLFVWLELPIIAFILTFLSIIIMVFQFFLYFPLIDFLYKGKLGTNVIGYIEPKEDVTSQIIISGHHDSARIFNFLYKQPKLYNLRVTGSIVFVIIMLFASLSLFFLPNNTLSLIIKIILTLGFLLTGQMYFFASNKGTPGAGDNLIASAMALELGRYFSKSKLKNTRIIIASFDAEEEGLRGAKAFAEKHEEDFSKIPTILLNTDCPYYLKDIFFLTSDINCSVELSESLAKDLVMIAKELGYNTIHKPIEFLTGGTDAGMLAKKGVKATTLMAMPWSNSERSNVYHTPSDTIESIESTAIEASIDIYINYIERFYT